MQHDDGIPGLVICPPLSRKLRTYVIIGVERGGTSPVAGVARAIGLFLGENLGANNEDQEFVHKPLAAMKKTIERRNNDHEVWGWKCPKAAHYLPLLLDDLRNPHLIVVCRDPVAVSISNRKWNGREMSRAESAAMGEAAAYTVQNLLFAQASGAPTLLISHELFQKSLGPGIDMISDFLQMERPTGEARETILAYASIAGYKDFNQHFENSIPILHNDVL